MSGASVRAADVNAIDMGISDLIASLGDEVEDVYEGRW